MAENQPTYDLIGVGYSRLRRTDPRIFARIIAALAPCADVINVGAGSGLYEPPNCTLAVEPSLTMIEQRPGGSAPCVVGVAENLPVADQSFDGSLAALTLHHWSDRAKGLRELCRVSRERVVLFTWVPDFDKPFWLTRDYIPELLDSDWARSDLIVEIERILGPLEIQVVPVPADCLDGFLSAHWKRPRRYLHPKVRASISCISQLDQSLVDRAMARLRADLDDGTWEARNAELSGQTELDLGYRLIISDRLQKS